MTVTEQDIVEARVTVSPEQMGEVDAQDLACPNQGRARPESLQSTSQGAATTSPIGQFFLHLAGMCVAMCGGGAILSLAFFGSAGLIGYSDLDRRYPELSILVAAVAMSAAMAAWMAFRHHPVRHSVEMSGSTILVGITLSSVLWLGLIPETSLNGWTSAHAMLSSQRVSQWSSSCYCTSITTLARWATNPRNLKQAEKTERNNTNLLSPKGNTNG